MVGERNFCDDEIKYMRWNGTINREVSIFFMKGNREVPITDGLYQVLPLVRLFSLYSWMSLRYIQDDIPVYASRQWHSFSTWY